MGKVKLVFSLSIFFKEKIIQTKDKFDEFSGDHEFSWKKVVPEPQRTTTWMLWPYHKAQLLSFLKNMKKLSARWV